MNDVSRILEVIPVLVRENITPRGLSTSQDLEAAKFLHSVNLSLREVDARIDLLETICDLGEVSGRKPLQLMIAIIMSKFKITPVL